MALWSACHPKTDEELLECSTLGKSLNRLSQPTILTLLARSSTPLHGYVIPCGICGKLPPTPLLRD